MTTASAIIPNNYLACTLGRREMTLDADITLIGADDMDILSREILTWDSGNNRISKSDAQLLFVVNTI